MEYLKDHLPEIIIGGVLLLLAGLVGIVIYTSSVEYEGGVDRDLIPGVEWEGIGRRVYRTKLPDGWLVVHQHDGVAYIPDQEHEWLRETEEEPTPQVRTRVTMAPGEAEQIRAVWLEHGKSGDEVGFIRYLLAAYDCLLAHEPLVYDQECLVRMAQNPPIPKE